MLHLARYSSITPSDFERALGITVGFDSMFDRFFGDVDRSESATGYPPYNIRKDEENIYTIEMAVAGFSKEDLEAELKEGILTVRSKQDQDDGEYLHRGIAKRAFSRSFTLSDDVVIKGADLINGMLTISLERIIPEEKKSRMIEIGDPTESALKKIS
ncbi:MAG: Hsp20 family protein [SAR324 cluster bacterium]|nr:Hsp20 family protein [SAR324 cluster bacterium]MDP6210151.1 Hsp20 family protein [SAR324 cluster bacterium]